MSTRFASAFVALLLGVCLHAPSALAQLNVTATQALGAPDSNVDVTLTVGAGGVSDEVNLSAISSYTFNFLWDASVLDWNGYTSTVDLSASGPTVLAGSAVFNWFDDTFANPISSFAGGLSITANFNILNTAAYGASTIVFGDGLNSVLSDENFYEFSFSNVTNGDPMQVTVLSTSPVPEPAEVSMLIAGLGLMALVLRRRRNQG